MGKQIFDSTCSACHGEQDGVGPAFTGMAERAATRVEGMSAEDYLHQSIVDPGAYVVEGFKDVMPKSFGDQYSDTELKGLVAYIMADSGGGTTTAQAEPTEPATPESTQEAAPTPEVTAEATAVPAGDAAAGEELFAANCSGCHGEGAGAGPARVGMGERAATRVAGLSAEEYLRQSIVDPGAYIVDGFSDIMPKTFADKFSEKEINDLIAYLLTQ